MRWKGDEKCRTNSVSSADPVLSAREVIKDISNVLKSDEFQKYSTSDQSEMSVNHDDEDTKTDIFFAKQRQVQQEMKIYRWDKDSIVIVTMKDEIIDNDDAPKWT